VLYSENTKTPLCRSLHFDCTETGPFDKIALFLKPCDCYCTCLQVLEREVRNLVHIGHELSQGGQYELLRDALEVAVLVEPRNIDYLTLLARIELHLNINLSHVCAFPGFDCMGNDNMYVKCI